MRHPLVESIIAITIHARAVFAYWYGSKESVGLECRRFPEYRHDYVCRWLDNEHTNLHGFKPLDDSLGFNFFFVFKKLTKRIVQKNVFNFFTNVFIIFVSNII